jgi:hepatocyte growth factor-regulated tyrosine kinase substrate
MPRSARVEEDDDRDLKMALQLSLEEAKRAVGQGSSAVEPPRVYSAPVVAPPVTSTGPVDVNDPDLEAAIAASLKDLEDQKKGLQYPSIQATSLPVVPLPQTSPVTQYPPPTTQELSALEAENITLFATLIDRMKSSPPGTILRDPKIQELHDAVSALKPKVSRSLSTVIGTYGPPAGTNKS